MNKYTFLIKITLIIKKEFLICSLTHNFLKIVFNDNIMLNYLINLNFEGSKTKSIIIYQFFSIGKFERNRSI